MDATVLTIEVLPAISLGKGQLAEDPVLVPLCGSARHRPPPGAIAGQERPFVTWVLSADVEGNGSLNSEVSSAWEGVGGHQDAAKGLIVAQSVAYGH